MPSTFRPAFAALATLVLGTFVAASPGRAFFSFDVTPTSTGDLSDLPVPGDELTLNIRLRNAGQVFGVGAAVYGYSPSVVAFVSGQVVDEFLHDSCPPLGFCANGIPNQVTTPVEANAAGVGPYVQFATGIATSGPTGDGSLDPGLDGVVGGGDALFRLTFRVLQPGLVEFRVGTSDDPQLGNAIVRGGGVLEQAVTHLTFIPEPGTALLVGLGLASLARPGTRRCSRSNLRSSQAP